MSRGSIDIVVLEFDRKPNPSLLISQTAIDFSILYLGSLSIWCEALPVELAQQQIATLASQQSLGIHLIINKARVVWPANASSTIWDF